MPLALRQASVPLLRIEDTPHPERAVARGDIVKVRRGVYAPAEDWRSLAPWDRYLARVHAVALVNPYAVFCLESAAALLGLPVFGDPRTVHVIGSRSASARLVGGVRTHTASGDRVLDDVDGLFVASAADTAVDIARLRHPAVALSVADAALRADRTLHPGRLAAVNESRPSSRGRRLARWVLDRADGSAESPLESVDRAVIEWLGFPAPRLQVVFASPGGYADRPDFWWDEYSLMGEADGDIKYDGSLGDPLAALNARRDRDMRLRSHARAVVHWGWKESVRYGTLRDLLNGAGLPIVAPESTAPLLTLQRLLAPR